MVQKIDNLRARADGKLRYAAIHLEELRAHGHKGGKGGDEFSKAHQESFLYHLFGAKDAFVSELNVYYRCDLPQDNLSPGNLRQELTRQGKRSAELAELYWLENGPSWFYRAKKMRDHSTHVSGVARTYYHGGPSHENVSLLTPGSDLDTGVHFINEFQAWHSSMTDLLERLRKTAIQTNQTSPEHTL